MDSWLRPILARKPTSTIALSTEQLPGCIEDDNNENDEGIARIRSSSRISTYNTVRTPSTPADLASDTFPHFRQPEVVWIKPSVDQMVEVLKVIMMTRGCMDPVPVEYNSTILHILEAYYDLQTQLQSTDKAIKIIKQSRENDINEFEVMADQWQHKELDYQSEVKRLEVLLSKTPGGMESVMMARSSSVISGSEKASEIIRQGIGTIKNRNAAHSQDLGL